MLKLMIFERTISSVWMMPKVTFKYSGKFRFPQTEELVLSNIIHLSI